MILELDFVINVLKNSLEFKKTHWSISKHAREQVLEYIFDKVECQDYFPIPILWMTNTGSSIRGPELDVIKLL